MNKSVIHYAELSLIASVTGRGVDDTRPKTRLNALYTRAFKIVFEQMVMRTRFITDADINRAGGLFEEWASATGWGDKNRHDCTRISFALRIIEQSKYKYSYRLAKTLMDIIDYFERDGNMPAASCWAGDLAGEKWESLISETQAGKRPVPVAIAVKPKLAEKRLAPWQLTLMEAQGVA